MRKFTATLLVAMMLVLSTGCTTEVQIGQDTAQCIGVDDKEDPRYEYEWDTLNIIGAVVFFEILIPPIYVLLECVKCPKTLKATVDHQPGQEPSS